ncbi:MAG: amino acid permease [Chloroflexi bacterium HGW-Chloroflexi-10]|nr:MAG: amino acid permease [Chloroflexi bacterium HGW-Chloroflexi-10]
MLKKFKYMIIGSPLPNEMMEEKRLNKFRALAAFSPDALSSVAYANQEIFLGLVVAGAAGLSFTLPIALAITLLLGVVALSYAQTIRGYPSGGGSYIVAKENLGTIPGLVAGAALLLDYVLTSAVSLTAGVAEIASAFPVLLPYRVWLALGLLVIIMLLNLRGLRESGTIVAFPVYLFLFSFIGMLLYGIVRGLIQGTPADLTVTAPVAFEPLTVVLLLHAFSAGCTALTGIEAISNGVTAFKAPEWVNARKTLVIMSILMGFMFLGSMGLTQFFGIIAGENETILSALARHLLGTGPLYYLVQFSTLGVLAVAANTSFAGFPRVTAILANDKFMPRQLFNIGDRLVFQNGIMLLTGFTALLIILFAGDSHALIPLFAVGAFTAFTLSQAGMVIHWWRSKEPGWLVKSIVNALGALVTFTTLLVVGYSKFLSGAWISVLVIPIIVFIFLRIRQHYKSVAGQLSMKGLPPSLRPFPKPRVVIPVSSVHRGMVDAVNFSRSITEDVTAVYVDINPGPDEDVLRARWNEWFPDVKFVVVSSPYRSITEPLLSFLDQMDLDLHDGRQAVLVLPELIPASPIHEMLHNQAADQIKKTLLFQRRKNGFQRIIIDVPYHLK